MADTVVAGLVRASRVLLDARCRQHTDRGKRMLKAAVARAGASESTEAEALATDMARFLADECDDDPLAAPLILRARTLGLLP